MTATKTEVTKLRKAIRESLKAQGFHLFGKTITFRQRQDKRSIRKRHQLAVAKRVSLAKASLETLENKLISFIASGNEVNPTTIVPRLHQVEPDTIESRLFRYACLHWSVPVSGGYGRRLRFLIFDDSNGKLIGLFGLGDPVYSIRARDEWIGWNSEAKADRLYHVMDAYVLGAVPPYSHLLGGKFVALAAVSDEVQQAFATRYSKRQSLIAGKTRDAQLVLLTTASALGRSSLYNRLNFHHRKVFESIGFTRGWGEFHFSDGVYEQLTDFARVHCTPSAKQKLWGSGFRNRRELVGKALTKLGYSQDLLNHGIRREVFVAPLASNAREFLSGTDKKPCFFNMPFSDAASFWRERWMLQRASRDCRFQDFERDSYLLW